MDDHLKKRIVEIRKDRYYPIKYLFFRRYSEIDNKNVYFYDLTEETRFKIIQIISEYKIDDSEIKELIRRMEIEFGKEIPSRNTAFEKLKNFLFNCSVEEFLTSLEILISLKYEKYLVAVIFDRSHVRKSTGEKVIVPNNRLKDREEHLTSFIKTINKIFKIDKIGYNIIPVGLDELPFLVTPYFDIESIMNSLLNINNENFENSLNKFEDALEKYNMNKFEESVANLNDSFGIALKSILRIRNIEFEDENIQELFSKIQHETIRDNSISFDFIISLLMNKLDKLKRLFKVSKREISDSSIKDYNKFIIGTTWIHIVILINEYGKGHNCGEIMIDTDAIFIGKIARLIEKREDSPINWWFLLETYDFDYLLKKHDRLIKSHDFGDEDYPSNLIRILKDAYKDNKDATILMIKDIFKEYLTFGKEDFSEYPWLNEFLEKDDFEMVIPSKTKYLDIETLPDDFYRDLRDLINRSYSLGLYLAVQIFSRKMLENLIVDVLRRNYSSDINLFYIPKQGRFHGFKTLLENFQEKLNDFKTIVPSLDKTFIKKIDAFRVSGNSSAHTLELTVNKKDLNDKKDDLNSIVKTLIRILDNS